jgi:hypothetical protein
MVDRNKPGRPWYREPMMWLVLGGPALVVVASLSTYAIAVHKSDPVIERDAVTEAERVGKELTPEQRESLLPALKARNHVASPMDPADR